MALPFPGKWCEISKQYSRALPTMFFLGWSAHFAHCTLHTTHSTSCTLRYQTHCTLCTSHSVQCTLCGMLHTVLCTPVALHTIHTTHYAHRSAPQTLNSAHGALCTVHTCRHGVLVIVSSLSVYFSSVDTAFLSRNAPRAQDSEAEAFGSRPSSESRLPLRCLQLRTAFEINDNPLSPDGRGSVFWAVVWAVRCWG